MGADKKVRQHAGANSASTAILREGFACEKQRRSRCRHDRNVGDPQRRFKILDGEIAGGRLRINDIVDQQWSFKRGLLQMGQRPVGPFWIVNQEIDQYVGIDQRHLASLREVMPWSRRSTCRDPHDRAGSPAGSVAMPVLPLSQWRCCRRRRGGIQPGCPERCPSDREPALGSSLGPCSLLWLPSQTLRVIPRNDMVIPRKLSSSVDG